jgi:diacylglycerol O-acyltransferase / trehalose O-mycolyltransferase
MGQGFGLLPVDGQGHRQRRLQGPKSGSPTFYLLPGIDGGDNLDPGASFAPGTKSWFGMTDIQGFFADKNVNVVSPLGGQFSWYTDWIK